MRRLSVKGIRVSDGSTFVDFKEDPDGEFVLWKDVEAGVVIDCSHGPITLETIKALAGKPEKQQDEAMSNYPLKIDTGS